MQGPVFVDLFSLPPGITRVPLCRPSQKQEDRPKLTLWGGSKLDADGGSIFNAD